LLKERIAEMEQARTVVASFEFPSQDLERGYAGRTLRIDLDSNECRIDPVTQQMKDLWVGGKGFDLWLMFQEINPGTKWDSPENPICFASGPLGGTTSFPGSGKTLVTAISPMTNSVMDSNVGGYFGPYLKFAGFDALSVVGKAGDETIIFIDATRNRVTIERAPKESVDSHILAEELAEMYADDDLDRKNIAAVSAGRGADYTRMGVLNFSFWDWRRNGPRLKQAGRGGIGTVFRNKGLKAIVIKNRQINPAWRVKENKVAAQVTPTRLVETRCPEDIENIRQIISKWNADPEYVIEIMQDIQEKFRFISKTAIDELCSTTGVPKAYLYHIATFYKAFSLEPRGETIVQVCMGTACHVKGAANLLDTFERVLEVKEGGTTRDEKYTLEAVACLGACSIAPVIRIGDEVIGNVQSKDIQKILKNYEAEHGKRGDSHE